MRPSLIMAAALAATALVLGGAYLFAVSGPTSLRAEYRRDVRARLEGTPEPALLQPDDLAHLPDPVRRYVQQSGAVGQPRVHNLRATFRGRIRSDPESPWMTFTGEQHNFFDRPERHFYMDARMSGVPVQVLHRYVGPSATMRVRIAGALPMVNAAGPVMDQSETVTLFNDMCWLAPGTLVSDRISWEPVDAHTAKATYRNAGHAVHATLFFNDAAELVNFTSDDRQRASKDGSAFTPAGWSTPLEGYRAFGAVRLGASGTARWHVGESTYAYIELELLNVTYNVPGDGRDR